MIVSLEFLFLPDWIQYKNNTGSLLIGMITKNENCGEKLYKMFEYILPASFLALIDMQCTTTTVANLILLFFHSLHSNYCSNRTRAKKRAYYEFITLWLFLLCPLAVENQENIVCVSFFFLFFQQFFSSVVFHLHAGNHAFGIQFV